MAGVKEVIARAGLAGVVVRAGLLVIDLDDARRVDPATVPRAGLACGQDRVETALAPMKPVLALGVAELVAIATLPPVDADIPHFEEIAILNQRVIAHHGLIPIAVGPHVMNRV